MTANSSGAHPGPRFAIWLGVAVLLGYWAVAVNWLGGLWSILPEYSYGWAVPLLCLMMLLERWRTRPRAKEPSGAAFGWQVIFVAALVFGLTRVFFEITPYWRFAMWSFAASAVILTLGGIYLVGGGRWVIHFGFPVMFFMLAIPWPERFEWPFIQALTRLNAAITVEALSFIKIIAVRIGNLILIERGVVGVEEACSGIRSFQSTLMVSLFLGELFRFSFWRRIAFLLLGALISFGFNVVRTAFLVWKCSIEGVNAVDRYHDPAGFTILGASFVSLLLLAWALNRQQRAAPVTTSATMATGPRPAILPRCGVVLFLCLALLLLIPLLGMNRWFRAHELRRMRAPDWKLNNEQLGDRSTPVPIKKSVSAVLGYDQGVGWRWEDGSSYRWQAFLFEWDAGRSLHRRIAAAVSATRHQPEDCFTAAGMQMRQKLPTRIYVANGIPLAFNAYEFVDRGASVFVFSSLWEQDSMPKVVEGPKVVAEASTLRAIRESFAKIRRGDRGIISESRVFKLGVWGPRTIGEAEAAFQQQLNLLVQPKEKS